MRLVKKSVKFCSPMHWTEICAKNAVSWVIVKIIGHGELSNNTSFLKIYSYRFHLNFNELWKLKPKLLLFSATKISLRWLLVLVGIYLITWFLILCNVFVLFILKTKISSVMVSWIIVPYFYCIWSI